MKYKLSIIKTLSFAVAFLCSIISANAQTVTIAGTQPVDIGCEYKYTATVSNVPTDWTIVDYKWQATYVGASDGSIRYVSGFSNGNPVYTTETVATELQVIAKTKDFWVKWSSFFAPTCARYR
jgi:hypothetical protein